MVKTSYVHLRAGNRYNVTHRGTWYPSGDLGNSSKSIIKGYMEENMKNRQILFKTYIKVEFHGENDEINKKYLKFYDHCIVGILLVQCLLPFGFENN